MLFLIFLEIYSRKQVMKIVRIMWILKCREQVTDHVNYTDPDLSHEHLDT